ncbi:MAG: hypothetical protein J2P17_32115, partial [Mycobacterium sp.]|nr:hypothetical protein [Mycobacterium sp.]
MTEEKPIRVAVLDHTASLSGAEIALLRLLRAIDGDRFTPVAVLFGDGPLNTELARSGIETRLVPLDRRISAAPRN